MPALTFSFLARSTTSGIQLRASPTQTTVDSAMHRCPAAPNAAPTSDDNVASLLASGRITPWFFAAWLNIHNVSNLFIISVSENQKSSSSSGGMPFGPTSHLRCHQVGVRVVPAFTISQSTSDIQTCIVPVLTYGCETWATTSALSGGTIEALKRVPYHSFCHWGTASPKCWLVDAVCTPQRPQKYWKIQLANYSEERVKLLRRQWDILPPEVSGHETLHTSCNIIARPGLDVQP